MSALKLFAGDAHPDLAKRVAEELSVPLEAAEITHFADGETSIDITADVRDALVFIVQPTSPPVSEHLLTLALMIDAVRAAGAVRITALVPYFGYARQEQRSHPGEPRSAQVAARLLAAVGLDHLVTLDLHAPALESAFPMPVTQLRAEDVFLRELRQWDLRDLTVVAPDAGGLKRAQRYAMALSARLAVIAKTRPGKDVSAQLQVLGEVQDRTCLLVDDLASTGRTLAGGAEALRQAGARDVHAVFTHAVMAPDARERLLAAPLDRIATSDSIPVSEHPRIERVSIAPLLAQTVRDLSEVTQPRSAVLEGAI